MSEDPLILIIDDLLRRVDNCILYCNENGLVDPPVTEIYLATQALSHPEMFQLDDSVRRLCQRVRGDMPQNNDNWKGHYEQLFSIDPPKTFVAAMENARTQLRITKSFVRTLLSEQIHKIESAAPALSIDRRSVVMGHVIQGNAGQVVVDSIVDKSTLTNSVKILNDQSKTDVAEFLLALSDFVGKSGNREAADIAEHLNEEISRPKPRKSLIRKAWDGLSTILPAVKDIAGAAEAIEKILN